MEPICGVLNAAASLSEGTCVIRPVDVRATIGGALPLLPLVDEAISMSESGSVAVANADLPRGDAGRDGGLILSKIVQLLTALLEGGNQLYVVEVARTQVIPMLGHLLSRRRRRCCARLRPATLHFTPILAAAALSP